MRRYQAKLGTDSTKLESQAKELIALRLKDRALLVIKLKRFKQKELDGIDSKLMFVQSQISDLEWASINVSILIAIESGTKELNRIHEERSLEDVEALMDDTNEAIEVNYFLTLNCFSHSTYRTHYLCHKLTILSKFMCLILAISINFLPSKLPIG